MTDVRSLLQSTLDTLLVPDKIYSHWGVKADITGENPNYYCVYSVSQDTNPDYADNEPISREAYCIISFCYRKSIAASGRAAIKAYETSIKSALRSADFVVSSFDDNDPDDEVFARIVIEATFGEVI